MPDEAVPMLSDVDHAAMFQSAMSDETPPPVEPTPEPQPEPQPEPTQDAAPEPRVDATGRVHGPDGKFAPKQAQADAAPTQPPPGEQQPAQEQESDAATAPSWRLRELREQRDAERQQREAAERRAQDIERQFRELQTRQQPPQPQPQVEIDPLTDPQGYAQAISTQFEQRLARMQLDNNLQLSRLRHGEKFDEAFQAFMQAAEQNPHLGQAVVRSSNPGDTLWNWYQGQTILREVGPDPAAYKQKLRDELLKDPAFQAEVVKTINGASQQPGATRPPNLTQLPPSLSKATGATANTADTTPTGAELFQHALRG